MFYDGSPRKKLLGFARNPHEQTLYSSWFLKRMLRLNRAVTSDSPGWLLVTIASCAETVESQTSPPERPGTVGHCTKPTRASSKRCILTLALVLETDVASDRSAESQKYRCDV